MKVRYADSKIRGFFRVEVSRVTQFCLQIDHAHEGVVRHVQINVGRRITLCSCQWEIRYFLDLVLDISCFLFFGKIIRYCSSNPVFTHLKTHNNIYLVYNLEKSL